MKALIAASCLCLALSAHAQGDTEPLPYSDDESPAWVPKVQPPTVPDKSRSMGTADDPNLGLGAEGLVALALPDSAKAGVDPRPSFGARLTWEYGRLIPDEVLREIFFVDFTWRWTPVQDGTDLVQVVTQLHHLSAAPAFAWPIAKSFVSLYASVGGGVGLSNTVTLLGERDPLSLLGSKFLFQYGLGLRGRPALTADGKLRLIFRVEVTRYVRGYLHDMFLGGSLGLSF